MPKRTHYHPGLPQHAKHIIDRVRCGLPVYYPTNPAPIDQRPYLDYLERDRDSFEKSSSEGTSERVDHPPDSMGMQVL